MPSPITNMQPHAGKASHPQKSQRVFISYQHVEPDRTVAEELVTRIAAAGVAVVYDQHIEVGEQWFSWIDREVRGAEFLIVLISGSSIRSDMVREEIKLAHERAKANGGFPKILPVRINFSGDLPYDLGAYLNPLQYVLWTPGTAISVITDKLLKVILKGDATTLESPADSGSPRGQTELYDTTAALGAPLPCADYLLETGAMKHGSPFYVNRPCDDMLFTHGTGNGVTMVVKGPRQVGKSSLLARFCSKVRDEGAACFLLDFQTIDEDRFSDLQTLCRYIAKRIEKFLKPGLSVKDAWDDDEGPKMNLMNYINDAVLREGEGRVYFLFDEVDRVFPFACRNDFFAALRAWHNERSHNECWNRLNLILAHSTEPHLWITDEFQSPFNVGHPILMDDFNFEQTARLNGNYAAPLRDNELQPFLELTGGHPFLVRQGLFALHQAKSDLRRFTDSAATMQGPYGDHLKRYLWCLQQNKPLLAALRDTLKRGKCDDEIHFAKLRSGGLIKGETRDNASLRCGLYHQFFSKHL